MQPTQKSSNDNPLPKTTTISPKELNDESDRDTRVSRPSLETLQNLSDQFQSNLEEFNHLTWDKTFHVFKKIQASVPIAIPLKLYSKVIQQFQNALKLSGWRGGSDLTNMSRAREEFRQIRESSLQGPLKQSRKSYESTCESLKKATGTDLITKFIEFRRSLSKVRHLALECHLATATLKKATSSVPFFSSNAGFTIWDLQSDLSEMRSIEKDAYFFQTKASRKNRYELAEKLRHYLSSISDVERLAMVTKIQDRLQHSSAWGGNLQVENFEDLELLALISELTDDPAVKALVTDFINHLGTESTSTEIATLLIAKRRILSIKQFKTKFDHFHRGAQTCKKISLTLFATLCGGGYLFSRLGYLYQNPPIGVVYGNQHRFITQCLNPGYEPLSSIEEAFYRYESGEIVGKQIIVDLFLAGEKMTKENARIAFQLAIDDPKINRIELLNAISREFLEDFECAGNSILVTFIRHNVELPAVEAAMNKGASLEASLHGVTPLMAAVHQDKADVIRLLWTMGANVSDKALNILKRHHYSHMRHLACEIENCNTSFTGVTTELHRLVNTGSAEELASSIDAGADVNVWDENGRSPLDVLNPPSLSQKPMFFSKIQRLLEAGTATDSEFLGIPLALQIYPSMFQPRLLATFPREVHAQKRLSHAFEMDEPSHVCDRKINIPKGGVSSGFALKMTESFESFIEQYGEGLDGQPEISWVRSILPNGTLPQNVMDAREIVSRITDSKEIVQIHSGFDGHAIEMLFLPLPTVTYLVINDKANPWQYPLEIFLIDPKKVTEQNIQKILDLTSQSVYNYVSWHNRLFKTLGAQSTPLGARIKEAYPGERQQKVDNCAWATVETAVYSALALGRLTRLYPAVLLPSAGDLIEKELQFVAHIFSQWQVHTQLVVAEDYLDLHATSEMQLAIPMDQRVMNRVFAHLQEAVAILPDGQERFAKAEARYSDLLDQEELLGYHMHSVWMRTFATGLREQRTASFIPKWLLRA